MRIRDARPADLPAIGSLLEQLGYADTETFLAERLAQQGAHPDAALLVAEQDGRVVGLISLHFIVQLALAGDFCRVSYLCVDAAVRAGGIGAALLEAAQRLAEQRGCDRMELHCDSRRVAAHGFYARLGYEDAPKYFRKSLR
ncbi:GNAT family N-acetyltransferase [Stutzerimonas stutzeri]|jgi:GNAT superfamily N-acetyltransferase|uniref:GNAT family N-acetyltransferase n=1 Tax=Stutzerimonas stutzeri TaxID=316 RepID=A0A2N8T5U7_STUST|nr:GNAT family N-acetyltransferase [Stutzerimonas stutzeri]MCQ4325961.1 GNAT family N-acetyltransferase [Stutzerimonas stutzeri]PNG10130.1 GNAT family N-acetyltransferase [Stutzerimonas stutzeri]